MSDKTRHRWLHEQLDTWVSDRLVSDAQASAIRARYPLPAATPPWGTIIFSCLGAIVTGLGIILLIAYNWAAIPKCAKLGIVLGAVAAAHGAGLWLFTAAPRWRRVGEALCLLGTMLFGAGIWLVAQVYHIEEHFPTAFLVWGLGAGLMAWALPSIPQAMLAAVLVTIWGGTESIGFDAPRVTAPLLVLFGAVPLAYRLRSALLLGVILPCVLAGVALNIPCGGAGAWPVFSTLLDLPALLIAARYILPRIGGFPSAAPVCGFYGWTVYLAVVYLLSFSGLTEHLFGHADAGFRFGLFSYWLTPFALALAAWGAVAWFRADRAAGRSPREGGLEIYLVPLTALLAAYYRHFGADVGGWYLSGPFNLVFLGLSVAFMTRGCVHGLLPDTLIGSVMLVLLAVARYFDLFGGLLVRGCVFLAVGVVLFAQGIFYARARRRQAGGGAGA